MEFFETALKGAFVIRQKKIEDYQACAKQSLCAARERQSTMSSSTCVVTYKQHVLEVLSGDDYKTLFIPRSICARFFRHSRTTARYSSNVGVLFA
jgi:hypothetical protein